MRAIHVLTPSALVLALLAGLPAATAGTTPERLPPTVVQAPSAAPAPDAEPADEPGKPTTAPVDTGAAEPDRAKRLDALFAALKVAPDEESAKQIAARIDIALTPSGSDTADVLMNRAAQATEAKDYDLAIELLDGVLKVAPDHLEAWNKRATVFYLKQDFSDALVDLRQVVAREPRHYGAWAGIAIICKEIGDEKHALDAVRNALAVYPQLDDIKEMEEELSLSVEGRPI